MKKSGKETAASTPRKQRNGVLNRGWERLFFILPGALLAGILLTGPAINSSAKEIQGKPFDGAVLSSAEPGRYLTGPHNGRPEDIALGFLDRNLADFGLSAADLAGLTVEEIVSRHNGVTHLRFQQTVNGIEVRERVLSFNVAPDGSIINAHGRLTPDSARRLDTAARNLSAAEAVEQAALRFGLTLAEPLALLEESEEADRTSLLSKGGISLRNIPARLVYQPTGEGALRLAWEIQIDELDALHYWLLRVDAEDGRILFKQNLVIVEDFLAQAQEAGVGLPLGGESPYGASHAWERGASILAPNDYLVYEMPVESPLHNPQGPAGPPTEGRTIQNAPWTANASPFGWHDTDGIAGAEFTLTQGNNVNAYEDSNNTNSGTGPDCGATLDCNFPLDLSNAPSTYQPAAVANLFYWNNIIHDVWYEYGFDEASGNFQENNYGNGGSGSDHVWAEGQDGSGTCNANFGTPADGGNPRMQMYLCGIATPSRDGDLDNLVIAHEYWHGISNRLTGGPANVSCLNNQEQMGEGWSDWGGLVMTMEVGDQGTDPRGIATYLFGQMPNGSGIRANPNSTDMSIDPRTYSDVASSTIPHAVGSIWAAMLWEMTWALVDQYGFDPDFYNGTGGNNLAMQLVMDGLKLQPCSPGFVDGRDAILLADQNLTGGANQCLIWEAFAKRGLGLSANQGSSNSTVDGIEAFNLPDACLMDISGQVFDDLNGDGVKDPGEPALAGWTIQLDAGADGSVDQTTTTAVDGTYVFMGLGPGTYRVREVLQAGWIQTTPDPADIPFQAGATVTDVDFGDFQLISISGLKFDDQNYNGVQDPGEPPLEGWTIELDAGADGTVDQTTVTAVDGTYSFVNLGPGTYRLREVIQADWVQITTDPLDIVGQSGVDVSNVNFGNYYCVVTCYAFPDVTEGVNPLTVNFTATASVEPVCPWAPTWDWDFGDGIGTSTAQNPVYTYTTPGDHTWTMTVTNGGVTCAVSGTIHVFAYDLTFYDNYNRSWACANSVTGDWEWTALDPRVGWFNTGMQPGVVRAQSGILTFHSIPGMPWSMNLKYNLLYLRANGYYQYLSLRIKSPLYDLRTVGNPPVCDAP